MLTFGKIGRRLLGWFLLVALIPLLFMGIQGYDSARTAIEKEAYLHMQAVAATKVAEINMWFEERRRDIEVLSANPGTRRDVERFLSGHDATGLDGLAETLESFKSRSASYNYFCLYDSAGSAMCCTQLGEELVEGFGNSPLFRRAIHSSRPVLGEIYMHDRYGPAMQIANRIEDTQNQPIAVLVATLKLSETLNPIILDSTGLGQTGEAYIIDSDHWMLTPSRFMNHPAPLTHQMESEGIDRALSGTTGAAVYEGWYGKPVLGAYAYLDEQKWALLAEISADEAFAPLATFRKSMLIAAFVTLIAILLIVLLVSRSISQPIRRLAEASKKVSEGNLDQSLQTKLKDELGDLTNRFNAMVSSLRESRTAERESYESLVRAREDLLRAEKLAAVGELAASIVHEVRNPLSSVKMNLQILESKLGDADNLKEHTKLALTQAIRLEKLLTELLNFSKPVVLQRQSFSVTELIKEAAESVRMSGQLENRNLIIEFSSTDLEVFADRDKLHQVLLNLLLNAIQATSGTGGEIAVVVSESGGFATISIRDNGAGIPEDKLAKVFEPFITSRKDGTGLGLPNAKKIIEAHGGEIALTSAQDRGTTVSFTLHKP